MNRIYRLRFTATLPKTSGLFENSSASGFNIRTAADILFPGQENAVVETGL
jgi:hypothetical protein